MQLTCSVHYETALGESLEVVVEDRPTPMTWLGGGWWSAEVATYRGAAYRYRLSAAGEVVAEEPGWRAAPGFATDTGTVVDRWRRPDPELPALTSALFRNAVASRHGPPTGGPPTGITFTVLAPDMPPGHRPAIVGSGPALGDWEAGGAAAMRPAPFPWWRVTVQATGADVAGAEYKVVLVDDAETVAWEPGDNRTLPPDMPGPVLVTDDRLHGFGVWRGAGVALPVFSLRTARSVGVGQFTDLIPFVDWAAEAGMTVVQLLPVNDSIKTHDWADSYPYDVTSVRALHPMYLDLDDLRIGEISAMVAEARAELDPEPEIAYDRVIERKLSIARRGYDIARPWLDMDRDFVAFVESQWGWLGPYSMWCLLRDRYGTADSAGWPDHQRFDPEALERMIANRSEHDDLRFHWWIQHHLHRQFGEAADHARRRGIALKGDLPIGVSPHSVETWSRPALFHHGTQAGAPPDAFAVRGQNWGFPTYDWEAMAADGFAWWRDRFRAMAAYVDAYRIDHVLGFFRIWEVPPESIDGLLGRFRPCLPLSAEEVTDALGDHDPGPLLVPQVDVDRLAGEFGEAAPLLRERFFTGPDDDLRFVHATQVELAEAIDAGGLDGIAAPERAGVKRRLLDLAADALLVRVDDGFQPRISWDATERYRRLSPDQQRRVDLMAEDFFHRRHDRQWEEHGRATLPAVINATDMLACGEDLGMVPAMVPQVMNRLGLLGLEIERMPKALGAWISDPADAPYLSVVSPGTHDMSPLVEWWEEDPAVSARYWHQALGRSDPPPERAGPELVEAILRRHLDSPAMLCITPIADLLAVEERLRRADGRTERINQPADRHHNWAYRLHVGVEDLVADTAFTERVARMVADSGR